MISWLIASALIALLTFHFIDRRTRILRHGRPLRQVISFLLHLPYTNTSATCRKPKDTLPTLGNSIRFLQPRHVLFDWFVKQQQDFGTETYEISIPTLPRGVVVNSPEVLDFILKNENSITKGEFFRSRSWDLFGHGIISATGDLWRTQRKAGMKFFAGNNLELLVEEVLAEVYTDTQTKLRKAAQEEIVIDMQKVFLDLTTTVMGHMAYDMDIDASSPFSKAFDYASDHTARRFQNPFYRITEFFNGAHFSAAIDEVKRFGREIVRDARKRRSREAFDSLVNNDEVVFGTLIDSLLDSFGNLQIVADAALNFLSAGRDTTAQSMTWTLYALMRHPDILKEVRKSILPVFTGFNDQTDRIPSTANITTSSSDTKSTSNSKSDTVTFQPTKPSYPTSQKSSKSSQAPVQQPTETTAPSNPSRTPPPQPPPSITLSSLQPSSIPLLHATLYESLRLFPPVPIEIKQTLSPITLPDGTSLPQGAVIVWCIHSLNRSTALYGSDASSFRPDRWLDDQTRKFIPPKSTGEFPVFNGGPRLCLGKKMAEVMMSYVLGRVLVDFDFWEVDDDAGEEVGRVETGRDGKRERERLKERISQNSLTLPMLGGLPCRVSLR